MTVVVGGPGGRPGAARDGAPHARREPSGPVIAKRYRPPATGTLRSPAPEAGAPWRAVPGPARPRGRRGRQGGPGAPGRPAGGARAEDPPETVDPNGSFRPHPGPVPYGPRKGAGRRARTVTRPQSSAR
ncbi:hypothetical protein GCM10010363_14340 [Streptomyces omiyaensis]|nr:hypothetical protein GCM10010363_14340 [Streptomyces omiyaensis]